MRHLIFSYFLGTSGVGGGGGGALPDFFCSSLFPVQQTTSSGIGRPVIRRYFQHAHFIPIVGVGKRGVYSLVHGDLPRHHSFGTTLRFTGPVPADSRQ